jgi:hypothetical protein
VATPAAPRARASALVAVLTFGAGGLVRGWAERLRRSGFGHYVIPVLLANEAFGAWRVYAAGSAIGWW